MHTQSSRPHQASVAPAGPAVSSSRITARQREIVALVVEGHTNIEIASLLHISDRTVQSHVAAAMRHLGSTSRTQLAVTALRVGLVPLFPNDLGGTGAWRLRASDTRPSPTCGDGGMPTMRA
ncbi:response regulator transcription factor [Patulibacter sp.]|uniref:response regulator transcription factor n=1 Tax=Patulibacter sp. TaxID=1912859 RepID=UPI0027245A58|nr:LuxR C-terminal-related transcriptional regulator [Patulibacter sp.]MDO9408477.1 LuxR C-terminal-related transcriptional regulator [Patulibacter sp.]